MINKSFWFCVSLVMLAIIFSILIFNLVIIYPIYAFIELVYYKKNMTRLINSFCLKMREQGIDSFKFSNCETSARLIELNDIPVDFNYKNSEKTDDYKSQKFYFVLKTEWRGESKEVFLMETNIKQIAIENFLNVEEALSLFNIKINYRDNKAALKFEDHILNQYMNIYGRCWYRFIGVPYCFVYLYDKSFKESVR